MDDAGADFRSVWPGCVRHITPHQWNIGGWRARREQFAESANCLVGKAGHPLQPRYGHISRLQGFLEAGHTLSPLGDRQTGSIRDEGLRRGRATVENVQ